ncbi:hypothetical protein BH23ACT11_BH23ACT11_13380 [soil metagenome]
MSSKLIRWGGPAMMLGGLLWILTYLTEIAVGLTLGLETYLQADPSAALLVWLWPVFFMGGIFCLGVGLLGVRARLEGRSKKLGIAGTILASVAIAAASVNLVLLSGVFGEPTARDEIGFLGVIGIMLGSVLMGVAAVRAKVFQRWARVALALTPLAFVPAIIATIPLESIVPEYVIADLPFPVVGAVLATVGYAMIVDKPAEARDPAQTTA